MARKREWYEGEIYETSRYIHLNPVRANMVENADAYIWSNYNMIIGNKKEKIIDSRFLLNKLSQASLPSQKGQALVKRCKIGLS